MHGTRRRHDCPEDEKRRHEFSHCERKGSVHVSFSSRSGAGGGARVLPQVEHAALARIEAALRLEGYANYGGDWQCPSCRCRVADQRGGRNADLSLRLEIDGEAVRLRCAHGCRGNTIRAMLGLAAYVGGADEPAPDHSPGDGGRH